MALKKIILYAIIFVFMSGSSWGIWVQAGSDLNRDSLKNAEAPDLDFSSSNGFVTWSELAQPGAISAQQIYVKTWNGTDWQDVGVSLNISSNDDAIFPRIKMLAANEPWITWEQGFSSQRGVGVKRWNGLAWVSETGLDLFLNRDEFNNAFRPTIDQNASVPFITWQEVDEDSINRIHVSRHGSDWEAVGATLNASYSEHGTNPTVAMVGTTPYVAWSQNVSGVAKIVVKRFTGTVWEAVGGTLNANTSQNAFEPQIVTISGTPWVTWHEATASGTNVYVKSWNGVAWQSRGGSLNISTSKNARYPHLTLAGSTPYITWSEESGSSNIKQINVKYWAGSAWLDGGTGLNQSAGNHADRPRIGYWNDTVYVVWQEVKSGTSTIIVKHDVTSTATSTATPTFTATPTPSSSPTASPTVTPTYTSTVTPTQTETVTRTVTPTFTQTITPDWTHTATPTVTPTFTITLTATPSSTISPTTTATPSITLTYTKTPTASMTATPTITPYGISENAVKAYPMPATGNDIWFYYEMAEPGEVTISIYDINGHKGEQLNTVHQSDGYQRTHWDISKVAPGIYIYRLEKKTSSGIKQSEFKKVVITREP